MFEITRHLAEARETVPDLGDDGLPDLGLCGFPGFFCGYLAPEDALGKRAEIRGEEGERVVSRASADEGDEVSSARLRRAAAAI